MSIQNDCMVVNVKVGKWVGHRLDREITDKVIEEATAATDAARVNKHLVPKEAMKDIVAAEGAIRTHFYTATMPWKDSGERLLTRAAFTKFIEKHEQLVQKFHDAVNKFVTVGYPTAIERAEFRMGAMFKADDYPPAETLRHKFYVTTHYDAVTTAGDWRVQLDDEHNAVVRRKFEEGLQARITGAIGDLWDRLEKRVSHMSDTLADDKAIFRDTLISNIEDLVQAIPALNFTNDPKLEAIRQKASTLTAYSPADLRKDKVTRSVAAAEAQAIVDEMRSYMTAFSKA